MWLFWVLVYSSHIGCVSGVASVGFASGCLACVYLIGEMGWVVCLLVRGFGSLLGLVGFCLLCYMLLYLWFLCLFYCLAVAFGG